MDLFFLNMRMWTNQVESSVVPFFVAFLARHIVVDAHFTHQWAVHIEGGRDVADRVARDHGFINKGQVKSSISPTLYEIFCEHSCHLSI